MTKFRNLLVHRYAYIDEDRLWTIAVEDVDDLRAYLRAIQAYVQPADQ